MTLTNKKRSEIHYNVTIESSMDEFLINKTFHLTNDNDTLFYSKYYLENCN